MTSQDDELRARIKRVRARSRTHAAMPQARQVAIDDGDENAAMVAILRPQLAFVLGVAAMIAGRAFAMNSLMIEPSTDVLGLGEGAVVLALIAGIGLLFFRSDVIAVGALVVGAALGFLLESYYIPLIPGLMSTLYSPEYVALVILNAS